MRPIVSLRGALADNDLLGAALGGPSWLGWRALLLAAMGEPLTDEERTIFAKLTQREHEPLVRSEELWIIAGRRGGKSRAISALAIYLSALVDWKDNLSVGERGVCLILASNTKQARVVFGYVSGILHSIPALAEMVANETAEVISLTNGIDIEIRAASFRGLRGVTAVCVIADEIAFWLADEHSLNPDREILDALRPALATTSGLLAAIGSPYARRGEMWRAFRRDFGPSGDPQILVAQGESRAFNPTLPQRVVDRANERDPAAAQSEYFGNFRTDIDSFVSREAIEAATVPGRVELPPFSAEYGYVAFVDPSGGAQDSMTLAIAHSEGDTAILDAVREVKPPFSPDAVVGDFVALLASYGLNEVTGDRWGGAFVQEQFEHRGVHYVVSERNKSQIYGELLPLLNSRRVELLDLPRLAAQLGGLERRTARGGRDSIDHAPGAHDDMVNAAAGAVVGALGVGSGGFDANVYLRAYG